MESNFWKKVYYFSFSTQLRNSFFLKQPFISSNKRLFTNKTTKNCIFLNNSACKRRKLWYIIRKAFRERDLKVCLSVRGVAQSGLERCVRDAKVGGSNPLTPTIFFVLSCPVLYDLIFCFKPVRGWIAMIYSVMSRPAETGEKPPFSCWKGVFRIDSPEILCLERTWVLYARNFLLSVRDKWIAETHGKNGRKSLFSRSPDSSTWPFWVSKSSPKMFSILETQPQKRQKVRSPFSRFTVKWLPKIGFGKYLCKWCPWWANGQPKSSPKTGAFRAATALPPPDTPTAAPIAATPPLKRKRRTGSLPTARWQRVHHFSFSIRTSPSSSGTPRPSLNLYPNFR